LKSWAESKKSDAALTSKKVGDLKVDEIFSGMLLEVINRIYIQQALGRNYKNLEVTTYGY